MKRRGIPTVYADTQFRSRVEARWAAFFDMVEWPWTYEPYDLEGYIPDFSLDFHDKTIIVEVKGDGRDVSEAKEKIAASGWEGEGLVLTGTWSDRSSIGQIAEFCPNRVVDPSYVEPPPVPYEKKRSRWAGVRSSRPMIRIPGGSFVWQDALIGVCENCHPSGITIKGEDSYQCAHWEKGECYLTQPGRTLECLLRAWREAGNLTQWRKRA